MSHLEQDMAWWNTADTAAYFAAKPADPRIVSFLETYDMPADARALDLGCGGGRHTEMLARHGFEVTAVDVNPGMLAATSARLGALGLEADVRPGSIVGIPAEDQAFDIVVSTGVLHQATSVAEYRDAAKEVARVLREGGYLLQNVFTNLAWDETYEVVSDDGQTVRTQEGLLMTLLSRDQFVGIMQDAGLELAAEQSHDVVGENTGPRAVYRTFFRKQSGVELPAVEPAS